MFGLSRREFFKICGLGLGGTYASSVGLGSLFDRAAMAAPIAQAPASSGAIFFVLNGGARTQAVFNGAVGMGTNPFGSLTGLPVPLSALMEGTGLDEPSVNARLNFVRTCQHHNRTGSHQNGRTVACTGYTIEDDKPGVLSLLNHAFAHRTLPCVNIGSDSPITNIGSEISSTFSPLKLSSFLDMKELVDSVATSAASDKEVERIERLRFSMQDEFLRRTRYRSPAQIPFYQRRATELAAKLADEILDVAADGDLGTFTDGSPATNTVLRPAFGVLPSGGGNPDGANALLALRFRQLGVAGIAISTSQNWDLHSNEERALPGRAGRLGQAIAGLVACMSQIVDPVVPDKTLLDTTVITIVSDFNRGNWSISTGYNENDGSDHRTNEHQTSNQCIPIIGGGLPGGKLLGEVGGDGAPVDGSPTYTTRQVLGTVLDLMGLPVDGYFPGTVPLTEELIA